MKSHRAGGLLVYSAALNAPRLKQEFVHWPLWSLPNRHPIKIITAFFIHEHPQITLHQVTCSSREAEAMTDLTQATRFPVDQTRGEKKKRREKEKKPTFSVTTCQSKHQGSCSGEDFGPETPSLSSFFSRSLWLKRRGGVEGSLWCLVCTPSGLQQRS